MTVKFPRWFVVWHLTASVLIVLALVGALVWSAGEFATNLSWVVVTSVVMLPLPLTYLFRLKTEVSSV